MSCGPLRVVLHHLHRLTGRADAGVSDAQLLQRFAAGRDEAAFELLLWRHGPMVRGVCRRMLRHAQDAEDACQATFLVLVRKAGSIGRHESLAGWLYRVAYRVALRARDAAIRRPAGPLVEEAVAPEVTCDLLWRDLRPVLDEEVHRLPPRYRLPVLLCYLQGKTYDQAARELGCPKGTLAIRLQRARELLRGRLTRRGVTLSTGTLAGVLTAKAASAAVPFALVKATARAALRYATGPTAAAGAASGPVVSLTEGVLRSMFLTKLKVTAVVMLLAAGLVGAGAGSLPRAVPGRATAADAESAAPVPENRPVVVNLPARRDGVLLFIGTEIKDGDPVAPEDVVSVRIDGEAKKFRRLKEGDKVEDGQLLARLDDRLARDDVEVQKAKLEAAEADMRAVTKTKEEARVRLGRVAELNKQNLAGAEELRAANLTWERYTEEEKAKAALVKQAKRQVQSAETVVEMHEIRAVRGTIKAILKQPHEAVKSLETVFQIQTDGKPAKPPAREPEKEKPEIRVPDKRGDTPGAAGPKVSPVEKPAVEPAPLAQPGDGEKVYYSRTASFYIPFTPAQDAYRIRQVLLHVSEDFGKTYQYAGPAAPTEGRFKFTARRDGTYWFVVQTQDVKGDLEPPTDRLPGAAPSLKVCVDTKPPVINLALSSPAQGKMQVEWQVTDENLDVNSLELAYRVNNDSRFIPLPPGSYDEFVATLRRVNNDSRFIPLPPPRSARGEQAWGLPDKTRSVEVRMKARDKAGNEVTGMIALPPGGTRSEARSPDNVRYVNSRRFELDFEIENVGKSNVKAVEIWTTRNGGSMWMPYKEVPPQGPFDVEFACDGRFGFKLVAVSGAGLSGPRPKEGDEPDLWVEVDTVKPEVQILGADLEHGDGPGKLTLRWKVTDKNKPDLVKVSYAESPSGPWKAIDRKVAVDGPLEWEIPKDAPYQLYFRIDCFDLAGNGGGAITPNPVVLDHNVPRVRLKGVKAKEATREP
jgi:RNA polymerase sigma factor (sigma-70 family)